MQNTEYKVDREALEKRLLEARAAQRELRFQVSIIERLLGVEAEDLDGVDFTKENVRSLLGTYTDEEL